MSALGGVNLVLKYVDCNCIVFSFLSINSISMHGMKSVQYSLPGKQVAVNFHQLYP